MVSAGHERPISPTSNGADQLSAQLGGNIAPQHLFDTVSLADSAFHSSLPGFNLRHPSPSPSALDGTTQPAGNLKTRVSELEVINDLFRGRVAELEAAEASAREEATRLRSELEASRSREEALKRRVEQLETMVNGEDQDATIERKRVRLSDASDLSTNSAR